MGYLYLRLFNTEVVPCFIDLESLAVEPEDVYDMNVIAPSIIIPKFSSGRATIKPGLWLLLYLMSKLTPKNSFFSFQSSISN